MSLDAYYRVTINFNIDLIRHEEYCNCVNNFFKYLLLSQLAYLPFTVDCDLFAVFLFSPNWK